MECRNCKHKHVRQTGSYAHPVIMFFDYVLTNMNHGDVVANINHVDSFLSGYKGSQGMYLKW